MKPSFPEALSGCRQSAPNLSAIRYSLHVSPYRRPAPQQAFAVFCCVYKGIGHKRQLKWPDPSFPNSLCFLCHGVSKWGEVLLSLEKTFY
jgi:hypothetical protein